MQGDKDGAKTLLKDKTNALLYASPPLNPPPDGAGRRTLNQEKPVGSKDPQVPRGDVDDVVAITTKRFAVRASLSDRLVQKLVAAGVIRSFKVGRARRIPVSELHRIVREGVTP